MFMDICLLQVLKASVCIWEKGVAGDSLVIQLFFFILQMTCFDINGMYQLPGHIVGVTFYDEKCVLARARAF